MTTRTFVAILFMLVMAAPTATAQDRPVRQRAADSTSQVRTNRMQARQAAQAGTRHDGVRQVVLGLSRRLDLDDRQINALRVAVEGAEDAGGASWRIAALLQRELTSEQKGRLFETAARTATFQAGFTAGRNRQASAVRGQGAANRGQRAAVRQQGRGIGRQGARGAGLGTAASDVRERADAMADALGLTESQRELIRIHRAIGLAVPGAGQRQAGYAAGPGNRARTSSR